MERRRRAGRGDLARHDGERCVAAKTISVRRYCGTGMQVRIRAGARCRLRGRIRSDFGLICSAHHVHGFIPCVADPIDAAIALRMRAVVSE